MSYGLIDQIKSIIIIIILVLCIFLNEIDVVDGERWSWWISSNKSLLERIFFSLFFFFVQRWHAAFAFSAHSYELCNAVLFFLISHRHEWVSLAQNNAPHNKFTKKEKKLSGHGMTTYLQQQFEICMAFFVRQLHYVPSMKSFHNLSHWSAYNLDVRIPSI